MKTPDDSCPARRRLLAAGAASVSLGLLPPRPVLALPARPRGATRRLVFENLHTGESLSTIYWEQGRYLPQALRELEHLLRDFRTGTAHAIAPGLLDLLCALRLHSGSTRPIQLISGYRSPATNAALRARSHGVAPLSLHMRGMAADIRIPGLPLERLHAIALSLRAGGVGFYPRSNFVHVDVGAVRRWVGA